MEKLKFLVFQHVENENPGILQEVADEQDVDLHIINFARIRNLPRRYPVELSDGFIIMGGPMGVNDKLKEYPSKRVELKTIERALDYGIPILGFCLGSQLLAHALGAKVYPNMIDGKGVKEIGYYDVELTSEGINDPIFEGFSTPVKVLQWHGDAFDLPEGATPLATSRLCKNQAFRYKNAYGFLFHFEFTPEMVDKQIEVDKQWIHKDFEMDEEKLKQEARKYASLMEEQCKRLFSNFLSIVTSSMLA